MVKFVSLSPSGLSVAFDLELHSEQPVVSVEEWGDCIEIEYIFPGFTEGDAEQQIGDKTLSFKELGISGAGFVSESGKPLLPSFGRFIQIPPGCDYEVSVTKCRPVTFDDVLVTPAQENATDRPDAADEFEYNAAAYEDEGWYPEEIVVVGEPQNLDDYRVVLIHVRPLRYNAAERQLVGYSNIKVTITLSARELDEDEVAEFPLSDPSVNREGFGNFVLNPRRGIAERMEVGPVRAPVNVLPPGPEFLIIYDKQLKGAAEQLGAWKNRKGLRTEIVSIKSVGNSVAKIKKYIRQRRKLRRSRLRYVLLMGDVAAIASEESAGATTDHYYFTSREPVDASDCVLPWVSGGRIPVNSLGEAEAVVQQVIAYERTPPTDSDYYRRMTFAAFFQDESWPQDGRADRAYMKTMEGIRDHMVSSGFDVERVYVSNHPNPQKYKDGTPVPLDVRNAIVSGSDATEMLISETSEGQLLIGHRDHGDEAGWSHPSFTKQHLPSILGAAPSIFYSINCLTGRFDYQPSDSFAEAIMELIGGAPSLLAATEASGTWRNDSLMKALFDAMWPGVLPGFPSTTASYPIKHARLGDLLNYAKSFLLVAHGASGGVKHHFEIYHVVGDPSLQMWSEEPLRIRLHAHVIRNYLIIHVIPAAAEGVVTIWYHGKLLKRLALSSSRIAIRVTDLRLQPSPFLGQRHFVEVCVSAPGHRYAQTRVRI